MQRRKFIRNTALMATGTILYLHCRNKEDKNMKTSGLGLSDFGVQLWTVREEMAKDPTTTLKAVADIGYTDVECAGYREGSFYGMSPAEFKKMLDDNGLKMRSGHIMTGRTMPEVKRTLSNDWEAALEDFKNVGQEAVFCGYFMPEERKSLDDYKQIAELFNKCGEKAKEYGLLFGHHNHDFEFEPIDGQSPMDILFKETDPDKVFFELDLYWTKKAGQDSISLFEKYPGRFPYWHVKDMNNEQEQFFAEVGSGIIDFPAIFAKAETAGLKHFYVEQDATKGRTPLESIRMSYEYLAGKG